VTAILAPGVTWENQIRTNSGQPAVVYNSKTNAVTWDLGTLPTGAGINSPKYEGWFQISITPSVNQVGQPVQLLKSVRFDGADAYTTEKIARMIPDLSTMSVGDSNENGTVQAK